MPIYEFKNTNTGEVFEEIRKVSERNKPFKDPKTGQLCELQISELGLTGLGSQEVYNTHSDYCKKAKPKFIKKKNGERVKFEEKLCRKVTIGPIEKETDYPNKNGVRGQSVYHNGNWFKWDDQKNSWKKQ